MLVDPFCTCRSLVSCRNTLAYRKVYITHSINTIGVCSGRWGASLSILDRVISISVSMSLFAFQLGSRVGEARNPGPPLSVAILNPTAMLNKTEAILKLPAQVMFCSETSVTVAASKILDKEFKKHKAKAFWSQFASPKIQTHDGRPSLRGDAVGCAIVSQVHSRTVRYKFPEVLWETCRICAAIIRCEGFEALMISIYGFVHNGLHDLKRLNDIILAHVVELISFVNLPFIIGGDFNIDVQTLPSFQLLRQMGAVEAFLVFSRTSLVFSCHRLAEAQLGMTRVCCIRFSLKALLICMWFRNRFLNRIHL